VENLEFATAAVVAYAFLKKVSIVRVHHAAAMRDVKQVIGAMQGECHVRT
jgi:dihydropteroate synthase